MRPSQRKGSVSRQLPAELLRDRSHPNKGSVLKWADLLSPCPLPEHKPFLAGRSSSQVSGRCVSHGRCAPGMMLAAPCTLILPFLVGWAGGTIPWKDTATSQAGAHWDAPKITEDTARTLQLLISSRTTCLQVFL